jgi:hypothetical protein
VFLGVLLTAGTGPGAAFAQGKVAADLSPEHIKMALSDKGDGCYELRAGKALMGKANVACFSTPYSRVVAAAQSAKRKYQPFTEADVTPELIAAGELHIHGFAKDAIRAGVANVETIVITPKGSKDKSTAIQPTKTIETTAEYKNLMGASFEGRSMTAVFPLDVLNEDNEVHIVYDSPLGKPAFCDDCKASFKLKDVR